MLEGDGIRRRRDLGESRVVDIGVPAQDILHPVGEAVVVGVRGKAGRRRVEPKPGREAIGGFEPELGAAVGRDEIVTADGWGQGGRSGD